MVKPDTSSRVEQRKFGLVMAGAFCVLGLLRWAVHHFDTLPVRFFAVAAGFGLFGLVAPRALQPVFVVWMKLAEALNWVMTRVFLTAAWWLIITPTSLIMRLGRKEDPLKRAWLPADATYWEPAEEMGEGLEAYKNQF
jgi:hypothetical protein